MLSGNIVRVRISENYLLHKSNLKNGKIVTINFFRTLEIKQGLSANQRTGWISVKTVKFVAFYLALCLALCPTCAVDSQTNSHNRSESSTLVTMGGPRRMELFQTTSQNTVIIWLFWWFPGRIHSQGWLFVTCLELA